MKKRSAAWFLCFVFCCTISCTPKEQQEQDKTEAISYERIVSLNGTITEILCGLGLEKNIVGVDVTSKYPASVNALPKVGHNRSISAEAVLSLQPDVIFVVRDEMNGAVIDQLESTGMNVIVLQQEFTPQGTQQLINDIAKATNTQDAALKMQEGLQKDMDAMKNSASGKSVMFIYARGPGTMMVAGKNTPAWKMIELAGAKNAADEFEGYKPFTSEALVDANPDVLLLFDEGLASLQGMQGLLNVKGVAQTTAGKNAHIITMDGQLLTGFGPRLGIAMQELSSKLSAL